MQLLRNNPNNPINPNKKRVNVDLTRQFDQVSEGSENWSDSLSESEGSDFSDPSDRGGAEAALTYYNQSYIDRVAGRLWSGYISK